MAGRRSTARSGASRSPLTRDHVVEAAVRIADTAGITGATMRVVAASLGVEAMSLYNHVANRADLLDGMVDAVFAGIALPDSGDWRADMRNVAESMRAALQRHSWATGMLDSRASPGEATLRHHDHVLGVLRRSGFSTVMAVHVLALIDGYVYGSVIQEWSLPQDPSEAQGAAATGLLERIAHEEYPNLAEIALERSAKGALLPGPNDEFRFGLDLILGALRPDE